MTISVAGIGGWLADRGRRRLPDGLRTKRIAGALGNATKGFLGRSVGLAVQTWELFLEDFAGWIAPAATMIAAMMTAANLGARVTGWGFVVFTVGSIAWSFIGFSSGQTNLLATNGFLTFVNLVGIWRWLGRQRAYEDGGKSATEASRRSPYPTLFTATGVSGMPVAASDGKPVGKAVEALVTCESGSVSYVVVGSGGVGGIAETLRAVARKDIVFACDSLTLRRDSAWFEALPMLEDGDWPAAAAELEGASAE